MIMIMVLLLLCYRDIDDSKYKLNIISECGSLLPHVADRYFGTFSEPLDSTLIDIACTILSPYIINPNITKLNHRH